MLWHGTSSPAWHNAADQRHQTTLPKAASSSARYGYAQESKAHCTQNETVRNLGTGGTTCQSSAGYYCVRMHMMRTRIPSFMSCVHKAGGV